MAERRPAEVFPPHEFIREEIEERGWTMKDFAHALRWSEEEAAKLANGETPVLGREAEALGHAFGTSAVLWANLAMSYEKWSKP